MTAIPAVHPTAILNDIPMVGDMFARRAPEHMPPVVHIGASPRVGPYAVIQRGVVLGHKTAVGAHATIFYGAHIGDFCVIGRGVEIGYEARIGHRVKIMGGAIICGLTEIGDDTFIGMGVITTNDDHPVDYRAKLLSPVRIGKRCQIGAGALIKPGVTIDDDAIVAMGAVVTRDVPAGHCVRGIGEAPARLPVANMAQDYGAAGQMSNFRDIELALTESIAKVPYRAGR